MTDNLLQGNMDKTLRCCWNLVVRHLVFQTFAQLQQATDNLRTLADTHQHRNTLQNNNKFILWPSIQDNINLHHHRHQSDHHLSIHFLQTVVSSLPVSTCSLHQVDPQSTFFHFIVHTSFHPTFSLCLTTHGDTVTASPPPTGIGDPALCGSQP